MNFSIYVLHKQTNKHKQFVYSGLFIHEEKYQIMPLRRKRVGWTDGQTNVFLTGMRAI